MPISYPVTWLEPFATKGAKYDKIKEIIDALNQGGISPYYKWFMIPTFMGNLNQVGGYLNYYYSYFRLEYADAVDNDYFYCSATIDIPTGWKAEIDKFIATVYQGTVTSGLWWREIYINIQKYNFSTNTRTPTVLATVSTPFGTTSGFRNCVITSFTAHDMKSYDDDSSNTINEIVFRYQVGKSAASTNLNVHMHSIRIKFTKL